MKIYIDGVLFLNFAFDFLILLSTSLILRRNIKLRRMFFGSIVGSLSILLLFINISSFTLFIFKILMSLIIIIITFGYKDIKYLLNNILYFYSSSIILGGFLYYLNIEFSYKQEGLVFFHNGLSINYIFLIIFSPLISYLYIKQLKKLKYNYSLNYKVDVCMQNNKVIKLNGYFDTGNVLVSPYNNKKIIITNDKKINKELYKNKILYIPYNSIDGNGLLKCIIPKYVYIEGIGIKNNILVGVINKKIEMEGINCILNQLITEE